MQGGLEILKSKKQIEFKSASFFLDPVGAGGSPVFSHVWNVIKGGFELFEQEEE